MQNIISVAHNDVPSEDESVFRLSRVMERIHLTEGGTSILITATILWFVVSSVLVIPMAGQLRNPGGMNLFWYADVFINGLGIFVYSALLILDQRRRVRLFSLVFMFFCLLSIREMEEIHRAKQMWGLSTTVSSMLSVHNESKAVKAIRDFR